MGAESLEAEQRGFNFLHLLAFSLRNDAEEMSNANKPPEGATASGRKMASAKRVRGKSFMQEDMKSRKKEKLTAVFAFSDQEFGEIQAIRSQRLSEAKKAA